MNPASKGRTADLGYYVTRATNPVDYPGCLLLLIGMPMLVYSAYLLYGRREIIASIPYALIGCALVGLSFLTPRLSAKSAEDTKESIKVFIEQGRAQDADAAKLVEQVRQGKASEPFWLFLRPFTLENELLVVSTLDEDLRSVASLVRYSEESFHNPKRQPVDLFDNLQFGFAGVAHSHFLAIGHRPHELHGAAGFLETTDDQWQTDILALAGGATLIVCMPWDTPGVLWETELLAAKMLDKTLFVMPPCYRAVESVRSHGVLPMPWFSTYVLENASDYARRWAIAIKPLTDKGRTVPDYNWHGLMFGYAGGDHLFALRLPVHDREFWASYEHIAQRLSLRQRASTAGTRVSFEF